MDQQRPFLYLSLLLLGFLIWSTWQKDHMPKTAAPVEQTAQVNQNMGIPTNSAPTTLTNAGVNNGTVPQSADAVVKEKLIHIKTDVLDLYISLKGGTIIEADLPTYPISLEEKDKPTRIINKGENYAAQSGLLAQGSDASLAPNHYAMFISEKSEYTLSDGQDTLQVPLVWENGQGIRVIKTFSFKRGKFLVNLNQQVENRSSNAWTGREYLQLTHNEHSGSGSIFSGDIAYVGPAYYNEKYIKVGFGDIADKSEKTNSPVDIDVVKGGWAAMLKHYFISAWIPSKDIKNEYYVHHNKQNNIYLLGVKSPNKTINTGTTGAFDSQFYVGPTDQVKLAEISKGLDLTVDYGVFAFVSKPIFAVMSWINRNIVSNWGWTIVLLTLFIKLLFFYPSAMSYKSMAKMKKFQPQIKALGDKYKNDPQGKQKATMALFKKEKINPLGGCLPMLIQMPVFMGLYWVLQGSVELRQAPWILWYKDLSIMDPWLMLPLIYGASMWFMQKLNPPAMQDPMQQKIFMYLPILFTFMFLWFPAGLVLYWVVNNLLSMAQQWFINKKIIGET